MEYPTPEFRWNLPSAELEHLHVYHVFCDLIPQHTMFVRITVTSKSPVSELYRYERNIEAIVMRYINQGGGSLLWSESFQLNDFSAEVQGALVSRKPPELYPNPDGSWLISVQRHNDTTVDIRVIPEHRIKMDPFEVEECCWFGITKEKMTITYYKNYKCEGRYLTFGTEEQPIKILLLANERK